MCAGCGRCRRCSRCGRTSITGSSWGRSSSHCAGRGVGLARWCPNGNPAPGKTIGLVLGVSLLACLVNPHHVRIFELPPELAYVVVSVTDPVGLPLPDALVAGGRTLSELNKADIRGWTVSTLSSQYWGYAQFGMNIAGFSVYFLLVLGLVSFTLTALVKPQPNAPTMQVNRFLLWLVFGVLALALYRLIPFFALIAAPLTAMTLGEFLLWQQDSNAVSQEKRDRGLQLARLMSVPFMFAAAATGLAGQPDGADLVRHVLRAARGVGHARRCVDAASGRDVA